MTRKNLPAVSKAQLPANWEDQLAKDAQKTKDAEAATGGGNFLSIRAGVMAYQGTPLPDSQIDVVVLDYRFENTYYPGTFDADNPVPPVCYAIGTVEKDLAPPTDDSCSDRQADACQGCPQNEFGTSDRGKGKACKNIRRLALLHSDYLKPGADSEHAPIVMLKVPPTSLGGWAQYVKKLAGVFEKPPYAFVTRIKASPDPKVQVRLSFELVAEIKDKANLAKVFAKRAEAQQPLELGYTPSDEADTRQPRRAAKKSAVKKAKAAPKASPAVAAPADKAKKGAAAGQGFKF